MLRALSTSRRPHRRGHAAHIARHRTLGHSQRLALHSLGPPDSAAREAMEEAGLTGRISDRSIGFYHHEKRLADGSTVPGTVETFVFDVEKQFTSWPEQDQRHTQWFELEEAADAVQEAELSAIILRLAALLA